MKKQPRKPRKQSTPKRAKAAPAPEPQTNRRDVLRMARNGLIAAGVLGGGAAYAVSAVRTTAYEQDLSRIGQGLPVVVQIHDPSCSMCTALQRETRKALKGFDDGEIGYVVANIKTQEGLDFASRNGVSHVTLMLMDPKGGTVQVLNGPRERDELRDVFTGFVEAYQ